MQMLPGTALKQAPTPHDHIKDLARSFSNILNVQPSLQVSLG